MPPTERDVRLLHFQAELVDQLLGVRRSDKALKIALRQARQLFGAERACLAVWQPDDGTLQPRYQVPRGAGWDPELLARLSARRRPKLPARILAAPIERRGRLWGQLLLARDGGGYDLADRRALRRVAVVVSRQLQRTDGLRLMEVRARIERKILEQLSPKDLAYQLLHGLRSLTRYDHSAAVLTFDGAANALRLVAEQISWRKGKSRRVGASLQLTDEVLTLLETGEVYGLRRPTADTDDGLGRWRCWSGRDGRLLAEGINAVRVAALDEHEQPARSLLVAPLVARDQLLGVLEIAACQPDSLGVYEVEQMRGFLPHVAVAVANLQRAETLEAGLLAAERKHVMANLARGVSHDVNNAMGAILPIVQQMQVDLAGDRVDRETLLEDLSQVEGSVQLCRRIFGGMLAFAQGSSRHLGSGDLGQAVASALAVLEESLRRQQIEVALELPAGLPTVSATRGDLEQLLLNLAANARDAMPEGGSLTILARRLDGELVVEISDTGRGIAADDLERVVEPFFTTKRRGHGLGLSICRSIVWSMGGSMRLDSSPGRGTTVTLHLPANVESLT